MLQEVTQKASSCPQVVVLRPSAAILNWWKIILETGQSPFIHVTSPEALCFKKCSNKIQFVRGVGTSTGSTFFVGG